MSAMVIDGKAVAAGVRARVAEAVEGFSARTGRVPTLATVLVGEDPASEIYVANKHRACEAAGMRSVHHGLAADIAQLDLVDLVAELGEDDEIDGILVQLPLPDGLDPDEVVSAINPAKDVDGLTATNAGLLASGRPGLVPCTPAGVIELLDHAEVELEGAEAVIVGRSNLVGKPLFNLLLGRNATVTVCHSRTRDLEATCRRADVLIAAVGVPELIGAGHIKPGATVIDVGMNRTEDGLRGDVNYPAVEPIAGAITPVPGGVGPMTIAMLLANTLAAAESRD